MTVDRRTLGRLGEQLAVEHLLARGYDLVARNWRAGRLGEVDVIARDHDCLVFVEVRTRQSTRYGSAEESVTPAKQARLAALAAAYCAAADWQGPVRVDVLAITPTPDGGWQIQHIIDAVSE